MNHTGRKIASNILFLGVSQAVTLTLTSAYMVIVPRYLGPEKAGILTLAGSISAIIVVLANFGTRTYILREVARSEVSARKLVAPAMLLNAAIGLACIIPILLFFYLINAPSETMGAITVVSISTFLSLICVPIQAALQGMERMGYSLAESIVQKGIATGLGITFAITQMGVVLVLTADLLSIIPQVILNIWWFSRHSSLSLEEGSKIYKLLLKAGLAFLVIEVAFTFYQQQPVVMLSWLASEEATGFYGVPYRLLGTLMLVPSILGRAVLPALSRSAVDKQEDMLVMARQTINFLVCLSLPIAVSTTVLAAPVINLLYGPEFLPAVPVMMIMGWVAVPTYLSIGIFQTLVAQERQTRWSIIGLVILGVGFVLNLIFIPLANQLFQNGAIGAAFSLLLTETIGVALGWSLMTLGVNNRLIGLVALKSLLASALMALAIWPIRDMFLPLPVMAGVLVYGGVAVITGLIPPSAWQIARKITSKVTGRFNRRKTNLTEAVSTEEVAFTAAEVEAQSLINSSPLNSHWSTTLRLVVLDGLQATTQREFSVTLDSRQPVLKIGRHSTNHIAIQEASISRYHIEFLVGPNLLLVRDIESSNGTSLNTKKLLPMQAVPIKAGDTLRLGDVVIRLEIAEPAEKPLTREIYATEG